VAEYVDFGDAEAAVCDILRADAHVSSFNAIIATDLAGYAYPARRLRVSRTGGAPTMWMRVDNAEIAIESSAESKAAALDMVTAARAAVFAARGSFTGRGLSLFDVADLAGGLAWTQDAADPDVARYVDRLSIVTRPAT
jgi:hypothetical protein